MHQWIESRGLLQCRVGMKGACLLNAFLVRKSIDMFGLNVRPYQTYTPFTCLQIRHIQFEPLQGWFLDGFCFKLAVEERNQTVWTKNGVQNDEISLDLSFLGREQQGMISTSCHFIVLSENGSWEE